MAFSPDGLILATVGADQTVILWDLTDRAQPARLTSLINAGGGHGLAQQAVAFTPSLHTTAATTR